MTVETSVGGQAMPVPAMFQDDIIGEPPPLTRIDKTTRSSPSPSRSERSATPDQTAAIKSEARQRKLPYQAMKSEEPRLEPYQIHYIQGPVPGKTVVRRPHTNDVRVAPYHVPSTASWLPVAATTTPYVTSAPAWVKVQPQPSLLLATQTPGVQTACVIQYPRMSSVSPVANQPSTPVTHTAPLVAMPLSAIQHPRNVFYSLARSEERQTHSPDSGFGECSDNSRPIDINDGFPASKAKELQEKIPSDPLSHTLPSGETVFTCQPCQMSFTWRRHLEQHFLVHRCQDKPALCHICGKCFTRADHLNRHCATHEISQLTCQLCGAAFNRASHLDKHWRTVHPHGQLIPREHLVSTTSVSSVSDGGSSSGDDGEKTESPTQVTQREQSREMFLARLLQPAQNSVGRPSLPMDINRSIGLKKGVRGAPYLPRRFSCTVCGRRFARSAHLHRHQRIHTGEKPFRCFQCGRSYARGDYLRAHLTMQHNHTELDCEVCSKPFLTISALNEHQRTEHGRMRAWYLQPGASKPEQRKQRSEEEAEEEEHLCSDDESDGSSCDEPIEVVDEPTEI